jgi:hypothetical protein
VRWEQWDGSWFRCLGTFPDALISFREKWSFTPIIWVDLGCGALQVTEIRVFFFFFLNHRYRSIFPIPSSLPSLLYLCLLLDVENPKDKCYGLSVSLKVPVLET